MRKLEVYLNFAGNAEEAFTFYRSVFGGEFSALTRFKDMPKGGGKITKNEENKVLNISLPINNDVTLMASDTLGSRGQKLIQGNNFYISITPDSKKEADRIFNKLSEDGRVILEMSDQPWNAYYGSFTDKFGVRWMVSYPYTDGKLKEKPAPKTKVKAALAVKAKVKTAPAVKSKKKAAPAPKAKLKAAVKVKIKKAPAVKKKVKAIQAPKKTARVLPAPKRKLKTMPVPKAKAKRGAVVKKPVQKTRAKRELAGVRGGKR